MGKKTPTKLYKSFEFLALRVSAILPPRAAALGFNLSNTRCPLNRERLSGFIPPGLENASRNSTHLAPPAWGTCRTSPRRSTGGEGSFPAPKMATQRSGPPKRFSPASKLKAL